MFLYVCHKTIVAASAEMYLGSWRMQLSNLVLLLVTAMTFAISLPFNNVLVTSISPILLALLRAMVAFPAM
jgi:drug/metabolite transporter (DMT)-like permease